MARRRRTESSARMHTTPAIVVENVNPMEDHPGLTPLEHRKIRRLAGKARGKQRVKVDVKVEASGG